MKLLFITLTTLSIWGFSYSQEFSYQMFFEDAAGFKDSITLGYDITATDSIDATFGEINIISTPLDSNLDVRISDEWFNSTYLSTVGSYHTKKQIVKNMCSSWFSISSIEISTDYWPVTATWDSSLFTDSCRLGSVFTSMSPGGWFDVLGPSNLHQAKLKFGNEITFTSNVHDSEFSWNNYYYINQSNDSIPFFWHTYGGYSLLSIGIDELNSSDLISLSPNPVSNLLQINYNIDDIKIKQIKIFDILGKEQWINWKDNTIDLSRVQKGLLIVQITLDNNQSFTYKIVKA